jgi:hypothetical protein
MLKRTAENRFSSAESIDSPFSGIRLFVVGPTRPIASYCHAKSVCSPMVDFPILRTTLHLRVNAEVGLPLKFPL